MSLCGRKRRRSTTLEFNSHGPHLGSAKAGAGESEGAKGRSPATLITFRPLPRRSAWGLEGCCGRAGKVEACIWKIPGGHVHQPKRPKTIQVQVATPRRHENTRRLTGRSGLQPRCGRPAPLSRMHCSAVCRPFSSLARRGPGKKTGFVDESHFADTNGAGRPLA